MLVHILQLKYKCTEDVLRNSIILAICSPYGLQRNIFQRPYEFQPLQPKHGRKTGSDFDVNLHNCVHLST